MAAIFDCSAMRLQGELQHVSNKKITPRVLKIICTKRDIPSLICTQWPIFFKISWPTIVLIFFFDPAQIRNVKTVAC